ncbi:TetR family transcriptional regulator [Nocardioides mangrovicus]|uniref:TetR family transcriptional regulator n=1 Tax=Nocardioides mangrovicus TaxID=2478913 RepID=A0A3L8NZ71_9ACTN|nr:TetR family transcriptional regulator [Nocardioides mangrovicus]RLV47957.1 TetR family transcriptional regulator [Nocardioides mangrovicus]
MPGQRARSPRAKQEREAAILAAAAELGARDGVREVTLTGIAEAVGLHKSAMLRYFETRELIFLRLAAQGWQRCSDELVALLRPLDAPGDAGAVAAAITTAFAADPLFCDLLAQVPLHLERNVSVTAVRDYKLATAAARGPVAVELRRLRRLDEDQCADVVATVSCLVGAMWQMANPGDRLAEVYRTDPQLEHAVIDLVPRVTRILTALLVGLDR